MVIAGSESYIQNTTDEVAKATVKCLLSSVPASVPAIAFLSGGQSPVEATAHLKAINTIFKNHLPWTASFSFGRAIQQPALDIWKGEKVHLKEAQELLYKRAKLDASAVLGSYEAEIAV